MYGRGWGGGEVFSKPQIQILAKATCGGILMAMMYVYSTQVILHNFLINIHTQFYSKP